jgi:hypothetical protein
MADVLKEQSIVALIVNKNGITAVQDVDNTFNPQHELWEPNLLFTPFKPGA